MISGDVVEHDGRRWFAQRHDRAQFEVHCFSDVTAPDADTARFRAHADGFYDISGMTDADVADLVRRQRIDILIDLAGLTQNNRMYMMARKPAPIRIGRTPATVCHRPAARTSPRMIPTTPISPPTSFSSRAGFNT